MKAIHITVGYTIRAVALTADIHRDNNNIVQTVQYMQENEVIATSSFVLSLIC